MADHYVHLADSQSWSEAHPADVASLSQLIYQARLKGTPVPSAAFAEF
jgi:hypothetical protein